MAVDKHNQSLAAGQKKQNKEGVRQIISRLPFTPVLPIGRAKYFFGMLRIFVLFFALNFFMLLIGVGLFFSLIVTVLVFSYVVATWNTKRLLDIKPMVNAKIFQIVLFVLFIVVQTLTLVKFYVMFGMLSYTLGVGSQLPFLTPTTQWLEKFFLPVFLVRMAIGIPILFLTLFLLFKKGKIDRGITEKLE